MVSLSIRRLRKFNFSNYGPMGSNIEISPQPLKIGKIPIFFFIRLLLTLWHFQNGLVDFHITFQNVEIYIFFPQSAILGTMSSGN